MTYRETSNKTEYPISFVFTYGWLDSSSPSSPRLSEATCNAQFNVAGNLHKNRFPERRPSTMFSWRLCNFFPMVNYDNQTIINIDVTLPPALETRFNRKLYTTQKLHIASEFDQQGPSGMVRRSPRIVAPQKEVQKASETQMLVHTTETFPLTRNHPGIYAWFLNAYSVPDRWHQAVRARWADLWGTWTFSETLGSAEHLPTIIVVRKEDRTMGLVLQ